MYFDEFLHIIMPVLLGIAAWYGFRQGYEENKKKKERKNESS